MNPLLLYARHASLVCAGRPMVGAGAPALAFFSAVRILRSSRAHLANMAPLRFLPAHGYFYPPDGGEGVPTDVPPPTLEKWQAVGAPEGSGICPRAGFRNPAVRHGGAGLSLPDPSQLVSLPEGLRMQGMDTNSMAQLRHTWLHWGWVSAPYRQGQVLRPCVHECLCGLNDDNSGICRDRGNLYPGVSGNAL